MSAVVTAVAVAAVATGASVVSQNKSRKAQERASRVQQKIESRNAQRDRMSALRQAQIARATAIQGAVTSGTADSSGLSGQLSGIQATTASNLAFSQQTETGVGVINNYMRAAGRYQSQAGTYSAIANLALTGAQFAGARGSSAPRSGNTSGVTF